jgi:CRISPR/Cas system CSM-associated protein Csm2 small subunit
MANLSAVEFVKVFAPMAKAGKSAFEIGQALGIEGNEEKVSQAVSVKASQLRKRLKEAAQSAAKSQGLDEKATEALVAEMAAKLPRIRSKGRASEVSDLVSAIDEALAAINAPADEVAE